MGVCGRGVSQVSGNHCKLASFVIVSELPKPEIELALEHSGTLTRWLLMSLENEHSVDLLNLKNNVNECEGMVWMGPALRTSFVQSLENSKTKLGPEDVLFSAFPVDLLVGQGVRNLFRSASQRATVTV